MLTFGRPVVLRILDKPISLKEIIHDISRKRKRNKASAKDSLNNEIIKISSISSAPHYVKLFNKILSSGVFQKYGRNKTDPVNYRGICISSCLGKFFTSILNVRLNLFL